MLLALAATLPAGCSFGSAAMSGGRPATHPPAATRPELTTYRGHGVTFTYPAAWRYHHSGFYATMTSPVIDLASQPTESHAPRRDAGFPSVISSPAESS